MIRQPTTSAAGRVGADLSDHLRLDQRHGNRSASAELTGADHVRPRMVPDRGSKMAGDHRRLGGGQARRAAEDCQCAGVVDLADDQRFRFRERAYDRTNHANRGLAEADLQPLGTTGVAAAFPFGDDALDAHWGQGLHLFECFVAIFSERGQLQRRPPALGHILNHSAAFSPGRLGGVLAVRLQHVEDDQRCRLHAR